MKTKKILLLVLSLALIFSALTLVSFAESPSGILTDTKAQATSGTTGDCTWQLDGTKLTISGNGAMEDYSSNYDYSTGIRSTTAPWGSSITEVTVENGVTYIGAYAFYYCSGLESVSLGSSVITIGKSAFQDCGYLTSVTIPDSVTTIESYAFQSCTDLSSVKIGSSVATIGSYAFYFCLDLKSITIPDSVTTIGFEAFYRCSYLSSISFGSSVSSIGAYAFELTDWLDEQPDGLVYAGKVIYTVKGECPSEVVLAEGTLGIADSAFSACKTLTSITIPASVKKVGTSAFYGCTSLNNIVIANGNPVYQGTGNCIIEKASKTLIAGSNSSVIPADGSVATIGAYAFEGLLGPATLVIPDSVTSIGQNAFKGCTNLTSVSIPNSVTSIGRAAFHGCKGLISVIIPESITEIPYEAFAQCTALKTLALPASLTKIDSYAFDRSDKVEDIYFEGNHFNEIGFIGYNNIGLAVGTWHYNACIKNTADFTHGYDDINDAFCNHCGKERTLFTPGDLDGVEGVSSADAIYLLYYTLFGEDRYPVNQPVDYDKNDSVNSADAIYLLYHTLFGAERYPL